MTLMDTINTARALCWPDGLGPAIYCAEVCWTKPDGVVSGRRGSTRLLTKAPLVPVNRSSRPLYVNVIPVYGPVLKLI
jgi:hypothetical protein